MTQSRTNKQKQKSRTRASTEHPDVGAGGGQPRRGDQRGTCLSGMVGLVAAALSWLSSVVSNPSAEDVRSLPEKDATTLLGDCLLFYFFPFSITRCSADSKINKAWFPVGSYSLSPNSSHSSHCVLSDRPEPGWC